VHPEITRALAAERIAALLAEGFSSWPRSQSPQPSLLRCRKSDRDRRDHVHLAQGPGLRHGWERRRALDRRRNLSGDRPRSATCLNVH
jgi:hypothetical protein